MNKLLLLKRKNSLFNSYSKKILNFLVTLVCIILSIYLFLSILFFHEFSFINHFAARQETVELEKKVINISNENERYISENKRLLDDDFFIESIARKDYLMVKDGEKVYLFKTRN